MLWPPSETEFCNHNDRPSERNVKHRHSIVVEMSNVPLPHNNNVLTESIWILNLLKMDLETAENVDGVLDGGDDDTEMVENIDEDDSNDGDKSLGNVRRREDFTSEIYKIEISNMGNFGYGVGTIFIWINQKRMLSESLNVALLPFSHTHSHRK